MFSNNQIKSLKNTKLEDSIYYRLGDRENIVHCVAVNMFERDDLVFIYPKFSLLKLGDTYIDH